MKVLAMHAYYQVLGGEDISHRTEVSYLRERGHEVHDLTVHNADLGQLRTPARIRATISNPLTAEAVRQAIHAFAPDVAYCNNLFPGLSSSVVAACRDAGIPVVRVLRNYRVTCAAGSLYRNGQHCESCVGASPMPGIVHGCYRESRPTTAIATLTRTLDRRRNSDTHWIAVSEYVRDIAIRAGLDADRITVRPNLNPPPAAVAPSTPVTGRLGADAAVAPSVSHGAERVAGTGCTSDDLGAPPMILYVGRDTPEKGLPLLLDAFTRVHARMPHVRLQVVGASRPHDATHGVDWLGPLPHEQVAAHMAAATVLAVPSTWAEPFGRVVVEALSVGTPVVASASGGLAELGGDAVDLFEPANAPELADRLLEALERLGADSRTLALERYRTDFAPEKWYRITLDVLERAKAG